MAVIFWAVGGVVASAILHDDHSAHSDYNNYGDHSDYSDAAERKRRRLETMKSEAKSQVQELSGYKSNIVNHELSSQTLKQQTAMRVSESEMDGDVKAKINRQIEHDQTVETSELKNELEVVDDLLSKISSIERENW